MSSHDVTMAGYLLIVASALALQLASRREESRVPSLGQVLSRIMTTRPGRIGLLAGWAWVGLHFFAK